jgi:nucleoside phosphorylase
MTAPQRFVSAFPGSSLTLQSQHKNLCISADTGCSTSLALQARVHLAACRISRIALQHHWHRRRSYEKVVAVQKLPVHDWPRFWCRRDQAYSLADGGFLSDPDSRFGSALQPNAVTMAGLAHTRCLALLGEPGIGKSTAVAAELSRLLAIGSTVISLDLARTNSRDALRERLLSSESTGLEATWLLDGLDEGLVRNKSLADTLLEIVSQRPAIKLRITCRTLEWPSALEAGLRDVFGAANVFAYELLPLRRRDVLTAAGDFGIAPEAFLDSVLDRDAVSLAIKPITLRFLLGLYDPDVGLPHSRSRLFDEGLLVLCSEEGTQQRGHVRGSADMFRRRATAARIAALSTLTHRLTIVGEDHEQSTGSIARKDIVGGEEDIAGTRYTVDAHSVVDTLDGAALFSARDESAYTWSHQAYREFLAGWYLAQRAPQPADLEELYAHGPQRRVPVILREVAAWHASWAPYVFDWLLEKDPEVLLRSDTSPQSHESRRRLAGAVLQRMADFESIDSTYWTSNYARLDHPDLADQLRPFINDGTANVIVRRVAMDIAGACKVTGSVEDLKAVARNSRESATARARAVAALSEIGHESTAAFFHQLLSDPLPDPDDTIRGYILSFLWPARITSKEMFAHLSGPQRADFTGKYQIFLRGLATAMRPDDLPEALVWVESVADQQDYDVEALARKTVQRSIDHLHRRDVIEPLTRILVRWVASYYSPWDRSRSRRDEQFELPTSSRRSIVREILKTAEVTDSFCARLMHWTPPLLYANDIAWLVGLVAEDAGPSHGALGAMVVALCSRFGPPQDACVADAIVSVTSPAFRAPLAPFLDPIEWDGDVARTHIARRAQWARDEARAQERRKADEAAKAIKLWPRLEPFLSRFESGDWSSWIDFVVNWSGPSEGIEELPEWQELSEDQRARLASAALQYANSPPDDDLAWITSTSFPYWAVTGVSSLRYLTLCASERVADLTPHALQFWAPVLLVVPFPDVPAEQLLRFLSLSMVHGEERLVDAVVRVVVQESAKHGHAFVLRKLPLPLSTSMQSALLAILPDLSDDGFGDVLELLVEHSVDARRLAEGAISEGSATRGARAAASLLRVDASVFDVLIARISRDSAFARQFAESLSEDVRSSNLHRAAFATVSDKQIATLHLALCRAFPGEPAASGRLEMRLVDHVVDLRRRLLRWLVEAGTGDALVAIEWLIEQEPDRHDLRWQLVLAKERTVESQWMPMSIDRFRELFVETGARARAMDGALEILPKLGVRADLLARRIEEAVPGSGATPRGSTVYVAADSSQDLQSVLEDSTGLSALVLSARRGGEWLFEAVPARRPRARPTRDVDAESMEQLLRLADVVVATATPKETAALLSAMEFIPGESTHLVGSVGIPVYTIGRIGAYAVVHLQTDMGTTGPNAASQAIADAIREVRPKIIFAVGIAFGISRSRMRLGDVLVAKHITDYEMQKLTPTTVEDRGQTLGGDVAMCERFQAYKRGWSYPREDGSAVDVFLGQVLSGAKLVNSREFRDSLAERFPSALGGEMEGAGVYAAAARHGVRVLLLKAVCDWADGLKNDRAQDFAAASAVSLLTYVLSKPDVLAAVGASPLSAPKL